MCMDPIDRKRYVEEKVHEVFTANEVLTEFGLGIDMNMSQWDAGNLIDEHLTISTYQSAHKCN